MTTTYLFDPALFLAGCEAAQAEYIRVIEEEDPAYLSHAREVVARARTMKPFTLDSGSAAAQSGSKAR